MMRSDGAGESQTLHESASPMMGNFLSPDGRRLAYQEQGKNASFDLWTLPLDLSDPDHPKPGTPEVFLSTPANEARPAFSPDGRWIAYYSDESGRNEVYVRPFPPGAPGSGGKWQVSDGGGLNAIWSRDGLQLFFESVDGHIMVADNTAQGDSFVPGKPRVWSPTPIRQTGLVMNMDLAPDGKRFAFPAPAAPAGDKGPLQVTFLLNFFDEVRLRVAEGNK